VPPKQLVFHQPLPQAEGLLRSTAEVLDIAIAIPHYTTLSRRKRRRILHNPKKRFDIRSLKL
jgi:hypothetical protein